MQKLIALSDIKIGEGAVVKKLDTHGAMRRRLQDMGLVIGTKTECLGRSPGGDPAAYLIRGAVIAIRREDSKNIFVSLRDE
ncbi:MAG: ferrous iron transport protein A [Clostridia bacterium]|nr:ferrous iron transport protein A [Clostridia bacterium]